MATTSKSPFSRQASNAEGGVFELPPAGQQPAVLIGLFDLGTHVRTFGAGEKTTTTESQRMIYAWELTDSDVRRKDGSPHVVGYECTISLAPSANMRVLLEGWLARTLQDKEDFDPLELLGLGCILNLAEGQSKSGKKFIAVSSVAKPMKGYVVAPATLTPFVFLLDEQTSSGAPPELPGWIPWTFGRDPRDVIKASKEWGALPPY
jgi:hypothetical protein